MGNVMGKEQEKNKKGEGRRSREESGLWARQAWVGILLKLMNQSVTCRTHSPL